MHAFLKLVEARIQKAINNGEFDNLPDHGKPLDLDEYFQTPAHLRMAYNLLKKSGTLPQEVVLMQEIGSLKEERDRSNDQQKRKALNQSINSKTTQLNIILERYRRAK